MRVLSIALFVCAVCFTSTSLAQDDPEAGVTSSGPSMNQGSIKDRGKHTRPMSLSGMLYAPWYYGVGIGFNARFEIPIVHDGFIPSINDQVSIEPSFSFGYRSRYYGGAYDDRVGFFDLIPAVYGMWSFHITPKFRPYGAIGLGYNGAIWLDDRNGNHDPAGFFYWDTAVGLFYNFAEHIAFRCEVGSQGGKAGLSILF